MLSERSPVTASSQNIVSDVRSSIHMSNLHVETLNRLNLVNLSFSVKNLTRIRLESYHYPSLPILQATQGFLFSVLISFVVTRFLAKMSERAPKIDKKAKCEICSMDFVGCEDPNLPVRNPCGCIFHEYCLYKFGGR